MFHRKFSKVVGRTQFIYFGRRIEMVNNESSHWQQNQPDLELVSAVHEHLLPCGIAANTSSDHNPSHIGGESMSGHGVVDQISNNDGTYGRRTSESPVEGRRCALECNPALQMKRQARLDIDPFPKSVLGKVDVAHAFKPVEKNGQFTVPITAQYKGVWNDAPVYLEEKSEVWCGGEYGVTSWLKSKRLGVFSTPLKESIVCEGQSTVDRYIGSFVEGGDNHIALLTAAYCVLFDRLWG
jgi:hypothetical protein